MNAETERPDPLPTLVWCVTCDTEWEVDNEPRACACDDGGFWRISVDGGVWIDQYDGTSEAT